LHGFYLAAENLFAWSVPSFGIHVPVLRIRRRTQGMLTAYMWWILMAASGQQIIGESVELAHILTFAFS